MTMLGNVLLDAAFSSLVAMGFALMFNVPRRLLLWCMLGGAIGHSLRTLLLSIFQDSLAVCTFAACVVVGIYSTWASLRLKSPAMIFQVTGSITMVPGAVAYQAVLGALALSGLPVPGVAEPLDYFARNFFLTAVLLGAISFGIILPQLLANREKPVI